MPFTMQSAAVTFATTGIAIRKASANVGQQIRAWLATLPLLPLLARATAANHTGVGISVARMAYLLIDQHAHLGEPTATNPAALSLPVYDDHQQPSGTESVNQPAADQSADQLAGPPPTIMPRRQLSDESIITPMPGPAMTQSFFGSMDVRGQSPSKLSSEAESLTPRPRQSTVAPTEATAEAWDQQWHHHLDYEYVSGVSASASASASASDSTLYRESVSSISCPAPSSDITLATSVTSTRTLAADSPRLPGLGLEETGVALEPEPLDPIAHLLAAMEGTIAVAPVNILDGYSSTLSVSSSSLSIVLSSRPTSPPVRGSPWNDVQRRFIGARPKLATWPMPSKPLLPDEHRIKAERKTMQFSDAVLRLLAAK